MFISNKFNHITGIFIDSVDELNIGKNPCTLFTCTRVIQHLYQ